MNYSFLIASLRLTRSGTFFFEVVCYFFHRYIVPNSFTFWVTK